MPRRTMTFLAVLALAASMLATPTLAGAAPPEWAAAGGARVPVAESETGSYVVLMAGEPLAASEGQAGVASNRGQRRGEQMRAQHRRAAADAGVDIVNQYTSALNGFSAPMSLEQARALAARDDVLAVLPDLWREATTDASPEFLGLTGPGGAHDIGLDGEGVVVGVIDTGIWPEHPSFADPGDLPDPPELEDVVVEDPNGDDYTIGTCEFGNTAHNPADADFTCNDKLVGARQMLATYRTLIGAEPSEFDSARDDDGHGTHTASTAAGNADVPATVGPHDLGTVTGIAPRAHVIAYKGLGALGGFSSDLAAAVDQAVADGVDVINYSIGGGPSLTGADDIAFLFAADAGVHVATSAGNSGPGAGSIGGPASVPWLTTVGASTQPRFFAGTVVLGNGEEHVGASLTGTVEQQVRLVDAAHASRDGSDLCEPGNLIRGKVKGSIVLCRRGAIARVHKSLAVLQADGVGMIMYENSDAGDRFTDTHFVPSVHVDNTEGLAIKDYIAEHEGNAPGRGRPPTEAQRATAAIVDTGSKITFDPAPSMTSFSSRGPDPVAEDLIKPDVTAPGMQILAGASPYADPFGNAFQSIAGTSMSSPHVAGLMALLDQAHPDWSPAAIKSSLMTTASQDVRDNDRTSLADPFDMGAGHVDPGMPADAGSAFDPGLVYDAGFDEYVGFLCDAAPEIVSSAFCQALADAGVPTTATDLNVPSIGVSSVPGTNTVTRTVTNVADETVTYTASVAAPDGFAASVSPSSLTLAPGDSSSFTVTLDTLDAPIGEWRFGSLAWDGGGYTVSSPIAARASQLDAPAEIDASGESGTVAFDVGFGYTGEYTAEGHGLQAATVFTDEVAQDPDQTFDPSDVGNGAVAHDVTVTDSALLRIAIPPDAVASPDIDIDLFVHNSAGELVASSTNGGTDELVDLVAPADDTYTIYIHGWQTVTPTTTVDTYVWDVSGDPAADDGSLVIDSAPASATLGDVGTVEASWSGATSGAWYLGAVSHNDADGVIGLTLLDVDNR